MSHKVIEIRAARVEQPRATGLIARLRDWNNRRIAKAELRALPDHLLEDLGIRRDLIDDYVDGTVRGTRATTAQVVAIERPGVDRSHAKAA
jgi:uncharacterized protein YjiS (DUF1127 family)